MSPLEIALIILGIITIIISCLIMDRSEKASVMETGRKHSLVDAFTEEDKMKLTEKINGMLSDISEETIIRTDDTLSKLSNEKIMAVNEFSEQIIEKIRKNHEEVVFLYSMLNDKEKELKAAVKEIDSSKKKVQDIIELKDNADKAQASKAVKPQIPQKPAAVLTPAESQKDRNNQTAASRELPAAGGLNSNNNKQILALYEQGKTVIEISKLLDLGQGEVKLVIDLFKGKR